jgi:hypothetical protein
MTHEELDLVIDSRLKLHGSPVIEFNRLAFIVGIPAGSWWAYTKDLPAADLPVMFRAGGSNCLHTADASKWCKAFSRKFPTRCGVSE